MDRTRPLTRTDTQRTVLDDVLPGPSEHHQATRDPPRMTSRDIRKARREKEPPSCVLEDGITAYRDKVFWFLSGDIILHSDATLFCVHKSILRGCGGFFDDLFGTATAKETLFGKDRLTISTDLMSTRELRVLLAYLYNEFELTFTEPSGTVHLYWEAAIALLRISAKLDMNPVREAALDSLDAIFPVSAEPVGYHPNIIGYASAPARASFWETFPIAVLDDFTKLDAKSLLPMAIYHAAQLPPENIEKALEEGLLSQEMADRVATTRRGLKDRYQKMMKTFMDDFDDRDSEAQDCLRLRPKDFSGEHWCSHVLKMMHDRAADGERTDIVARMSEEESDAIKHWACFVCWGWVDSKRQKFIEESWEEIPKLTMNMTWDEVIAIQEGERGASSVDEDHVE